MKAKKSHSKAGKMGEMDGGREVEERDVSPDGPQSPPHSCNTALVPGEAACL